MGRDPTTPSPCPHSAQPGAPQGARAGAPLHSGHGHAVYGTGGGGCEEQPDPI